MIIRAAEGDDLEPLSELAARTYVDAFGSSMSAADLAAHLENKLSRACFAKFLQEDGFLLAEAGGNLVGFVQIGAAEPSSFEHRVGPGAWELRRLYVLAAFQRAGLGQRLIDAALAQLASRSANEVLLDVWEDNHGARRLYERNGFRVVGQRAFHVQSGAPTGFDLIMARSGPF